MADEQLKDLTREDQQPVDWRFLRDMVLIVAAAMFVAGLLTSVAMFVLDMTFRIESSVAVVELKVPEGQTLSEDQTRQVLYDMVDPVRLEQMAKQIGNVNAAWFQQFPNASDAAKQLRSQILIAGEPGSEIVHIQLSGRPPMNVQTFLEILLLLVSEKPVLAEPTVKHYTGEMPDVSVEMVKPPSTATLVFPRLIPIGVILFIVFMPILPGALVLRRKLRGESDD